MTSVYLSYHHPFSREQDTTTATNWMTVKMYSMIANKECKNSNGQISIKSTACVHIPKELNTSHAIHTLTFPPSLQNVFHGHHIIGPSGRLKKNILSTIMLLIEWTILVLMTSWVFPVSYNSY